MLKLVQQGIGWTVTRDGLPVPEEGGSGVHKTVYSAASSMIRIAKTNSEAIEPIHFYRHHSNGWRASVTIDEAAQVLWSAAPENGGAWMDTADSVEDAEQRSDAKVVAVDSDHVCVSCGKWY